MFVRLRIMAHEALKQYMLNPHAPLDKNATRLIYDIIAKAESDEAFANNLDITIAGAFVEQTSDGLDDIIRMLIEDMPTALDEFLKSYFI